MYLYQDLFSYRHLHGARTRSDTFFHHFLYILSSRNIFPQKTKFPKLVVSFLLKYIPPKDKIPKIGCILFAEIYSPKKTKLPKLVVSFLPKYIPPKIKIPKIGRILFAEIYSTKKQNSKNWLYPFWPQLRTDSPHVRNFLYSLALSSYSP